MPWLGDALWVLGMLLTALACVMFSRRALRDRDMALAWTAGIAAAVISLADVLFIWWVW
jgi:hypothetical protein